MVQKLGPEHDFILRVGSYAHFNQVLKFCVTKESSINDVTALREFWDFVSIL
jgi:hypothetical protein